MASSLVHRFPPPLAAEPYRFSRWRRILPQSLVLSMAGRRIRQSSPVAAMNFEFTPPPIDHDVSEAAMGVGATISEDGIVESYGNDEEALHAAYNGLARNAITRVVSPDTCRSITEMLPKYIFFFFADKVEITDITKLTSFFVLLGPKSNEIMENLSLGKKCGMPYGSHMHYSDYVGWNIDKLLTSKGFELVRLGLYEKRICF